MGGLDAAKEAAAQASAAFLSHSILHARASMLNFFADSARKYGRFLVSCFLLYEPKKYMVSTCHILSKVYPTYKDALCSYIREESLSF
jgi:hypothetical protein